MLRVSIPLSHETNVSKYQYLIIFHNNSKNHQSEHVPLTVISPININPRILYSITCETIHNHNRQPRKTINSTRTKRSPSFFTFQSAVSHDTNVSKHQHPYLPRKFENHPSKDFHRTQFHPAISITVLPNGARFSAPPLDKNGHRKRNSVRAEDCRSRLFSAPFAS